MDEIIDEISALRAAREAAYKEILSGVSNTPDIANEISGLKAAREATYKDMLSGISKETSKRKFEEYKIKSAIKYESHIRSQNHAEFQTQLSTVYVTTTAAK